MRDLDDAPGATDTQRASSIQTVERERAVAFGEALRTIMQRQDLYIPRTGTFLLPQLYERLRAVDGAGIPIPTLRAYLRGDALPSDSKVRLLADALGLPCGVLLFASGYLIAEDLPNYPGPHASLASIEADIREVETMPLSADTKQRILHDLRTSARILTLIQAEAAQHGQTTGEDERELLSTRPSAACVQPSSRRRASNCAIRWASVRAGGAADPRAALVVAAAVSTAGARSAL